jgi:AcrR family transcriptional regulator
MGDIALIAGIAKATLYNHFRTRDELYDAVLIAEVESIAAAAAAAVLTASTSDSSNRGAAVLTEAARLVGANPAVRKIAADEPAVLAALATPGTGPAWELARREIASVLSIAGINATPAGVDVVLRYLASQLSAPSAAELRPSGAALLVAGLIAAAGAVPVDAPAAGPRVSDPDEGEAPGLAQGVAPEEAAQEGPWSGQARAGNADTSS